MAYVDVELRYQTRRKLIDPEIFARHMKNMLDDEQDVVHDMWYGMAEPHRRSGRYQRAITKAASRTRFTRGVFAAEGSVFVDSRIAPHARFFEYGTGIYRKGGGRGGSSKWIYPRGRKKLVFVDSRPGGGGKKYVLDRVQAQRSHELGKYAVNATSFRRQMIRKEHLAKAVAEQKARMHG